MLRESLLSFGSDVDWERQVNVNAEAKEESLPPFPGWISLTRLYPAQ